MQWLRLRPESPEELELVDWRGRWIDEDDEYDEEEEEDEEEDRQMEDFDPDALEEEDDDEEEEEEDASNIPTQHQGKRLAVDSGTLRPPTPIQPPSSERTSPVSSAAPQTPRDSSVPVSVSTTPSTPSNTGKVRVIKQWTPHAMWAPATRV